MNFILTIIAAFVIFYSSVKLLGGDSDETAPKSTDGKKNGTTEQSGSGREDPN